jgi:hypothetical protein
LICAALMKGAPEWGNPGTTGISRVFSR